MALLDIVRYRLSKFIKLLFVFGDDVLELSEVEKEKGN